MKLRCVTNSIRLRLRKSDIHLLVKNSELMDYLSFPNNKKLEYGITITEANSGVDYHENKIMIQVNSKEAGAWINSNEVSLNFHLPTSSGEVLKVLIEKDFPCKHTGNDFEDTFYELQPEEHRMYKQV